MKPLLKFTAAAALLAASPLALAITLGQTDTFDADPAGWSIGRTFAGPPAVVATGGPDGGPYLEYTSDAVQSAGKMIFRNLDQWSGDYLAAGVTAIAADVANLSATEPLAVRLAFGTVDRGGGGTWFVSTDAVPLAPGSGWTPAIFPIDEASLTRASGTNGYADVMSGVVQLRILSSAAIDFRGDTITATIGVDNVTAIPEPTALALGLLGLLVTSSSSRRVGLG